MRQDVVQELAHAPELISIAAEFIGSRPIPFKATLFDKSPDANWLVTWHQDISLPVESRSDIAGWGPWSMKGGQHYAHAPAHVLEQVVALRVHLDDSVADNGPLRVLPNTHVSGRLTDDRITELAATIAPVDCLVPAGGIVVMRPLIVHASSKSRNDAPRRVLHIEYAPTLELDGNIRLAVA
jgi:ectoine hydroxylase-related dioxygenase (phytanoyl-CoA dioxygenase family)